MPSIIFAIFLLKIMLNKIFSKRNEMKKKICIYFVLVHSSGEDRERESVCILLNYFVLFYVVWSIFRLNSNYGEREFMRRISKKKKMNKF